MKKSYFNQYFSDLCDHLHIDLSYIAESIDRHPSRIRHWRNDARPGKKIIHDLYHSLLAYLPMKVSILLLREFLEYCKHYAHKEQLLLPPIPLEIDDSQTISRYLCDLLLFFYELPISCTTPMQNHVSTTIERFQLAQRYLESSMSNEASDLFAQLLLDLPPDIRTFSADVEKIYALSHRYLGDINKDRLIATNDIATFDLALSHYQCALETSSIQSAASEQALIYKNLGILYTLKGNFSHPKQNLDQALTFYQKALDLYKALNTPLDVARVMNNIGIIHINYTTIDDVLSHCQQGIQVFEELITSPSIKAEESFKALAKINLATIYATQIEFFAPEDNYALAKEYFTQALEFFTIDSNPLYYANITINIANALAQLSLLSTKEDYLSLSIQQFKKAMLLFSPDTAPQVHAMLNTYLAMVYISTKEYPEIQDEYHDLIKELESSIHTTQEHSLDLQGAKTISLLAQYYGKKAQFRKDSSIYKKSFDLFDQSLSYLQNNDYLHLYQKCIYLYCTFLVDYYAMNPTIEIYDRLCEYEVTLSDYFNPKHFPTYTARLETLKRKFTYLHGCDQSVHES